MNSVVSVIPCEPIAVIVKTWPVLCLSLQGEVSVCWVSHVLQCLHFLTRELLVFSKDQRERLVSLAKQWYQSWTHGHEWTVLMIERGKSKHKYFNASCTKIEGMVSRYNVHIMLKLGQMSMCTWCTVSYLVDVSYYDCRSLELYLEYSWMVSKQFIVPCTVAAVLSIVIHWSSAFFSILKRQKMLL